MIDKKIFKVSALLFAMNAVFVLLNIFYINETLYTIGNFVYLISLLFVAISNLKEASKHKLFLLSAVLISLVFTKLIVYRIFINTILVIIYEIISFLGIGISMIAIKKVENRNSFYQSLCIILFAIFIIVSIAIIQFSNNSIIRIISNVLLMFSYGMYFVFMFEKNITLIVYRICGINSNNDQTLEENDY